MLFVPPPVTMLVSFCSEEDAAAQLKALGLDRGKMLCVAVNDGSGAEAESGTHWTLLVMQRDDGVHIHYDSLRGGDRGANWEAARRFVRAMARAFPSWDGEVRSAPHGVVQSNGSDCGVCLLATAEAVARVGTPLAPEVADAIDPAALRKHMRRVIDGLVASQQR